MRRRFLVSVLILFLALFSVGAVSLSSDSEVHSFDSLPMLEAFYDESVEDVSESDLAFWDGCTVSLLTLSKGSALYSWFGHSGILVETPYGSSVVFDYGTFSFSQEDFFWNFAMGRLWFCCYATSASYELASADSEGRSVSKVVLPLSAEQKIAVVNFLSLNSEPEYRTYLYHHYNDNCATRLRDIIDYATGGAFKAWASEQSGASFRALASRPLSQNRFALWALNLLQSGNIDAPNSLWESCFLPSVLEDAVSTYFGLERSFVVDHESSYRHDPVSFVGNWGFSALFGLGLAVLAFAFGLLGRRSDAGSGPGRRPLGRGFWIFSGVVDCVFALIGSVLLFMMVFTNHDVTWMNENILFVNPLLFLGAVLAFVGSKAGSRAREGFVRFNGVMLLVMCVLCMLKCVAPSVFVQCNWDIIITMFIWYGSCVLLSLRRF